MKRLLQRIVLALVAVVASIYRLDYFWLRMHLPRAQQNVTVYPYYSVKQRSGKSDFYMLDPQVQTCVDSLFPHMGSSPCWYLKKHVNQKIDM